MIRPKYKIHEIDFTFAKLKDVMHFRLGPYHLLELPKKIYLFVRAITKRYKIILRLGLRLFYLFIIEL